eukprot:8089353-Ditylum_brightwellii.AAC.1
MGIAGDEKQGIKVGVALKWRFTNLCGPPTPRPFVSGCALPLRRESILGTLDLVGGCVFEPSR